MTQAVPAALADEMVCERCGYVLTGLAEPSNCPECGTPIVESSPARRTIPEWEAKGSGIGGFIRTTLLATFRPRGFFRGLATRVDEQPSRGFARVHYLLASVLIAVAAQAHLQLLLEMVNVRPRHPLLSLVAFFIVSVLSLIGLNWLAARLTSLEARYRAMRLPLPVARRGLDYHAAHYFPVAMMISVTTAGYYWLRHSGRVASTYDMDYLYVLCGEVVVAAAYLFVTYWIAMRNMMYANR